MNKLITALATPYRDGKIDAYSYERLVSYQIANGVDALLAVGTTAEAQLLDKCEKKLLVKLAKGIAGNIPVFVGIEGRSTREAVAEAEAAEKTGADGILVAPPTFVKCTPQGYLLHIKQILNAVSVPLMLYNAPSRCNYVLDRATVEILAESIPYLKDAGTDLDYTAALSSKITVLSGNDGLLPEFLQRGAAGVVSVVSNVAPRLTRKVLNGYENAYQLFRELARLSMLEVSPIAIKYMLFKKRIFNSYEMRLPLTAASIETQREIDNIWHDEIK